MTENIHAIRTLTKYNNDIPLNDEVTLGESVTNGVVFGGALIGTVKAGQSVWKGAKFMRHPINNYVAWQAERQATKMAVRAIKQNNPIFSLARSREYQAYKGLKEMAKELPKNSKGVVTARYKGTQKAIQSGLNINTGRGYAQALKTAQLERASADFIKYQQKVAFQNKNGSLMRVLKNRTGLTKLSTASKRLATKSLKYGKFVKGVKGNAAAAVIFTGIGVFTEVIPAFRSSTEAGVKQIGKTTVKTGVDIAAFAAGAWAGAQAGAGIGAAVGTVFPGVGNAVGGFVGGVLGLIGGCAASYFADEAMEKALGKNEAEKAKDNKTEKEARSADKNDAKLEIEVNRAIRKLSDNFYKAEGNLENMDSDDLDVMAEVFGITLNGDSDEDIMDYQMQIYTFMYMNNPDKFEEFIRNGCSSEEEAQELLDALVEYMNILVGPADQKAPAQSDNKVSKADNPKTNNPYNPENQPERFVAIA